MTTATPLAAAPPQATAWWACGNAPHCSAAPSTQAPPPSGAGGERRSCSAPGRHDEHQGPHRRRPAHRAHRADDAAGRPTRHRSGRRGRRRARGSPTGAPAAPRLALRLRPPVGLFGIRMPLMDGIEATRPLAGPDVTDPLPIVVITTFDLDEYVHGALKAGARGV